MYTISVSLFPVGVYNLSFRQPSFKLQQTAKNKGCMDYTVRMHAWIAGPRSLVEGQHEWHRILCEKVVCMEL